jgi:2-methylcitrate dehydratase PrpD
MTSLLGDLGAWASSLDLSEAPESVLELAKSQVVSYLATVRAALNHPLGVRIAALYGQPFSRDARSSARALCGLGAFMHYDDTGYAGHLSQSTVAVPLAYAYHLGLGGRRLLEAVLAANETAARITAASTLGPHRGQGALQTHLVGAVAGRAASQKLSAPLWTGALSLALSTPPWSLRHGFFHDESKVLGACSALSAGLDAVDAAEAGFSGPADVLEHPDGFLAQYADLPLPQAVIGGLGRVWHTETLSIKVHPGGPGVDAAIDAASQLHAVHGPFSVDDVNEVVVDSSVYTTLTDAVARRYVSGPDSALSALLLSVAYPVATTLLTGHFQPADLQRPAVADPDRWALAAKVRVTHDEEMTRDFLTATAPIGEALRQAGADAPAWLTRIGGTWLADLLGPPAPPSESFSRATKMTPSRVAVLTRDGQRRSAEVRIPVGAAGPDTACHHRRYAADKLAAGGAGWMLDSLEQLEDLRRGDLRSMLDQAFGEPPAGLAADLQPRRHHVVGGRVRHG